MQSCLERDGGWEGEGQTGLGLVLQGRDEA